MPKRVGLGKGLDALFADNGPDESAVSTLKLTELEPNKNQPRAFFDDESLRELADSIRVHGVIQPLVARPLDTGGYQIVAGERRWRASRMAGLAEIPVIIKDLTDAETLEIGIIENLQREDLNVIELAVGYRTLMEQHGMTQEEVAAKLGKSRPVIANTIRLLGLPEKVLDYVRDGKLTQGHARALLSFEDSYRILEVAEDAVKRKLLVRDIEKLAKEKKKFYPIEDVMSMMRKMTPHYREMEIALTQELGRKVKILHRGKQFTLQIDIYDDDELKDFAERLTKGN